MKNNKVCIGIDLGTTYSCVGVWNSGKVDIVPNDQGNRTTPSFVAFTDDGILVGNAAKNQVSMNPKNTVYDAKRLIGREFNDSTIQRDKKHYSFEITNDNGKPNVKVTYKGEAKNYPPEFISSQVLLYMKKQVENYIGCEVTDAVVTVPAYFNDQQRNATRDAGTIAGLNIVRIINEPTAAAIAYGLEKSSDEKNIIIFDYGGGTLDVSILNISDGIYEVKATSGDTHLGGEDLDNRLVEYCIQEFKRKYKIDLNISERDSEQISSSKARALRRLKTICERSKVTLSTTLHTRIEIDSLYDGNDFECEMTRAKFEELCKDIFERIKEPLDRAIKDSKLDKGKITDVVLIGGSSKIPKIQEMLINYFNGKQLYKSINPDEAVAYGAAVQAALLMGIENEKLNELLLLDVVPLTLGVAVQGEIMEGIITRNTTIPVVKTKSFQPAHWQQRTVAIEVYEGERPMVKQNHFLGKFELSDLKQYKSQAEYMQGGSEIVVSFDVDANGILTVKATEKASGKTSQITIKRDKASLSEADIERMKSESDKYKDEDDKLRTKIEKKHNFDAILNNVENLAGNDKIDASVKKEFDAIIGDEKYKAMKDMSNFTAEDYENASKEIEEILKPIVAKMYQQGDSGMPQMNSTNIPNVQPQTRSTGPKIEEID